MSDSTAATDHLARLFVTLLENDQVRTALRAALGVEVAATEWLDGAAVLERYKVKMRTLVAASRRGKIELGRGGSTRIGRDGARKGKPVGGRGTPIVQRAELERFLVEREAPSHATGSSKRATQDAASVYDLAVRRAAGRGTR